MTTTTKVASVASVINGHSVCREFKRILLTDYPDDDEKPITNIERLIAGKLWKAYSEILSDYVIQDDEELVVGESQSSQEEWSNDDGTEIERTETISDQCSLEDKRIILEMIASNPNWKLETIQKKGGSKFKSWNYKKRWENQLAHGGTKFEKYSEIDRHVFEKFEEMRTQFKFIRGSHIKKWAIQRASEFRDLEFNFVKTSYSTQHFVKTLFTFPQLYLTPQSGQVHQCTVYALQPAIYASSFSYFSCIHKKNPLNPFALVLMTINTHHVFR